MTVRWGILGTGDIARQFAEDARLVPGCTVHGVGSRRPETAARFGDTHRVPTRYGTYEALLNDGDIDAVYIATPHPFHYELVMASLAAGKGVLCEKPLGLSAIQTSAMIDAARTRDLFLMEGLWTYFFPAMRKAVEIARSGVIGAIRMLRADFCFRIPFDAQHRLFDPVLGGGALLDVGIYPIALAHLFMEQEPESIHSHMNASASGVDEQSVMAFHYSDGAMALLSCASRTAMPQEAVIAGTQGLIRIPDRFSQPDAVILEREGEATRWQYPRHGYGYCLEIEEATRCVAQGARESGIAPHDASLAIARTMDRLREMWGLHYPGEFISKSEDVVHTMRKE